MTTLTPLEKFAIPDVQQEAAEPAETKVEDAETATAEAPETEAAAPDDALLSWPGRPGYSVFRLLVPVLKVGGIIGRKGDLIKKLVEETHARVRVLDGPITLPDRIVLISGKEEPEASLSSALDAIIRIVKHVNGLPESDGDKTSGAAFCSIRLLVASMQAISLIGKQGSLIKSIQELTGASVRVLSNVADEVPTYANSDERVVELQGEALKVLKALEAVVGHLSKFLVDHSVLPLFEKSYLKYNALATQERQVDALSDKTSLHQTPQTSLGVDYPVMLKRDSLFLDRESQMESHIQSSRLPLYGQEHGLANRSSIIGRSGGPGVTQVAQTMQIPLTYAEDIIGVPGTNIDYIRRSSGVILTVQGSRVLSEEITVEIKGTSSHQAAQQLIQMDSTAEEISAEAECVAFMTLALEQGLLALESFEVPVGRVIIEDQKVISSGKNRTTETRHATRHAEMEAIDSLLEQWQKNGLTKEEIALKFSKCTLYVTCEPCIMCAAALSIIGLQEVYYGCANDKFGGCGSIFSLHTNNLWEASEEGFKCIGGIMATEAINLLKSFYEQGNPNAPKPHRTVVPRV